jgi:thioester reductase-like protein
MSLMRDASAPAPIHHVSTIGVLHPNSAEDPTLPLEEDASLTSDVEVLKGMGGYGSSKLMAEKLMAGAHKTFGIPISVYRPGAVTGHSLTGASNQEAYVNKLIAGIVQLKAIPDVPTHNGFDWLPVNYCSDAIAQIALSQFNEDEATQNQYRIFHIINPVSAMSASLESLAAAIKSSGRQLDTVSFDKWNQMLNASIETNALKPLVHMFEGGFPPTPVYTCKATIKALEGSDVACPPIDDVLIRKYLAFYAAMGIIPNAK